MFKEINGQQYYDLLDYGVRNLSIYKDRVNALNVFPVPDGDTGTNMLNVFAIKWQCWKMSLEAVMNILCQSMRRRQPVVVLI